MDRNVEMYTYVLTVRVKNNTTICKRIYLREAFITDRSASESAEEKKLVIIEAE